MTDIHENVKAFLKSLLEELSYHPLVAPYLNVSGNPPIEPFIHQVEVASSLAPRNPIRVLIGDEIGLGKTITAISTAKILEKYGRVRRILIVLPRVLIMQWRKELLRMGVPASKIMHLERDTVDSLRARGFPEGYYLASMDLLKREEYIGEAASIRWDLIIIDEVHKFGHKTERFWRIGKKLVEAAPKRNVVFLSATPHRGDPEDYIKRLQLLDVFLVEGWSLLDDRRFYGATHGSLLFRRTKEDINKIYEQREVFKPAHFYAGLIKCRGDEAEFIRRLVDFLRSKLVELAYEKGVLASRVIPLLTVLIFKRASSSPYSAWTTLQRMLVKRAAPAELTSELVDDVEGLLGAGFEDSELDEEPEETFNKFLDYTSTLLSERDRREVAALRDMARKIMGEGDSKLEALTAFLEEKLESTDSKIIVFTEYLDTLKYLKEQILQRHPEWKGMLLTLSSEETLDERKFRRVKEAFETSVRRRILLATDVVAEGVNLQVANILVNYEIPWSLIKLEQRLGRVWRLGQKREVEAYTLFMNNVADRAALKGMYRRLLNLKRAILKPKPVTGERVILYLSADTEDLQRIPPPVTFTAKKGKRRMEKVTELKLINAFIREGEAGLKRLVESILAAKREIEREINLKGVLRIPRTRREVEETVRQTGFSGPREFMECLLRLLKASSEHLGLEVLSEEPLRVRRGKQMPVTVRAINEVYGFIPKLDGRSVKLTAISDVEGEVSLVPVRIVDERDGSLLYRDVVGIDVSSGSILRGADLLRLAADTVEGLVAAEEEHISDPPFSLQLKAAEQVKASVLNLINPVALYLSMLSRLGVRNPEDVWLRPSNVKPEIGKPFAKIRLVKVAAEAGVSRLEVSEEEKRAVEEEAVRIVMEIERGEGRIPSTVPEKEHYDVKSVDPSTGEVRKIEVKGHKGLEIYGELTDDEAELARRERDKYWLYIVYDIGSGKPKYVRFRNPIETMNWKKLKRVKTETRYLFWPRKGGKSGGEG
ncbi:helicase [Candidatus Bathyarchaeota archaeon ex4484_40]|nr:MAG: helicase [Candidatus Bathyarchaeota archaeon ex4484_40]